MKAPDEFRIKEVAISDFSASVDEVIAAWDAVPDSEIEREIVLPSGDTTNPMKLAGLAFFHTGYHDAQLNYLQAIFGDEAVHWE